MRADITKVTKETSRAMEKYQSNSIPLLVIIPPGSPNKPIILRDFYTRDDLLEKLREAVAQRKNGGLQTARVGGDKMAR